MKYENLTEENIAGILKEIENLPKEKQSRLDTLVSEIRDDEHDFPKYELYVTDKKGKVDMEKLKVCIYIDTKKRLKQNQNYSQPKETACA